MGDVGNFLFGGSKQSQTGQNSSNQSSNSSNSSTSNNVQASQGSSNQSSNNASGSANQGYNEINQALAPSLGYVTGGGNMLGALLGLPTSTTKAIAPTNGVLPHVSTPTPQPTGSGSSNMISTLLAQYLKSQTAAPSPTPTPTPSPTPSPVPAPGTGSGGGNGSFMNGRYGGPIPLGTPDINQAIPNVEYRAGGGPVNAGQPYVVGEKQPELFVPHTSGTIVPQVPGSSPQIANRMGMSDLLGRIPNLNFGGHNAGGPVMTPGGGGTGRPIPGQPAPTGVPGVPGAVPPISTTPAAPPAPNPTSALNTFANSAGENFILDQGQKAISGASAANGTFDSGATGKALTQYGQNLGSTYLNDYMNHLLDYAKLGLGGASAISGAGGVSQSVGSSSGNSNNSSFGYGSGSSTGSSTSIGSSSGTSSGSGNSKKGLVPDVLG